MSGIGSGLLPKVVALLVGVFGVVLLLQSLVFAGDGLERWAIRGPIMVLGAVAVFAFTVRSLGLVVAGPLCFIVAALADRDTRPVEVVVSAVIATLAVRLPVQGPAQPADPVRSGEHPRAPACALRRAQDRPLKSLVMGTR